LPAAEISARLETFYPGSGTKLFRHIAAAFTEIHNCRAMVLGWAVEVAGEFRSVQTICLELIYAFQRRRGAFACDEHRRGGSRKATIAGWLAIADPHRVARTSGTPLPASALAEFTAIKGDVRGAPAGSHRAAAFWRWVVR
jgi:hypothetical protein